MSADPDVLFLVLDSVRKDRVSWYGHDRETTPTLDAFAERATAFDNAYAPAPWTLPSHCSMFTGLYPSEHGVTNGFADGTPRLPGGTRTLAERLADRGYRTAGFSNNPWVGQLSGLDRGFREFVEWDLEIGRSDSGADVHDRPARLASRAHALLGQAARQPVFLLKRRFFTRRLVDRACDWFAATADGDRPTFTFLNLMEAHSPYFPPGAAFERLGLASPSPVEPRVLNTKLLAYVMGKRSLPEAERRRVMAYYDASLRFQDGQVARLFETLRDQGRLDDALVVVCADHGKTLGDVDRDSTPPHYTRDVNVNVPLFVSRPGQTDARAVTDPFELASLHDLVLDGGERPADRSRSDPSAALVEDHLPHTGRSSPDAVTRWRVLAADRHKYVRSDDGDEFLLARRDGTETPVADESTTATFREALARRTGDLEPVTGDGEAAAIDDAVQSQLRDLGYM
ncbi:MAG: sulfatase [Haloferacaceae archaeon]